MAVLTVPQKRFIVERLACYDTPQEVADAFAEEFGIVIPRTHVNNFDASKPYARIAKDLQDLYHQTRQEYRDRTEGIAIAQKAHRLSVLDRNERAARKMKNLPLSNACLEQAAKEMGEAYTNRHRVEHSGELDFNVNDLRSDIQRKLSAEDAA